MLFGAAEQGQRHDIGSSRPLSSSTGLTKSTRTKTRAVSAMSRARCPRGSVSPRIQWSAALWSFWSSPFCGKARRVGATTRCCFHRSRDTIEALWHATLDGSLPTRVATSLEVLLIGYSLALVIAMLLTIMAVSSSFGADVLTTLSSMFNPLPALAILPLALLWLGIGIPGLILVMVQSVVWTVAINTFAGFQGVPATLRMAGQNFGFSGLGYIFRILDSRGISLHPDRAEDRLGASPGAR